LLSHPIENVNTTTYCRFFMPMEVKHMTPTQEASRSAGQAHLLCPASLPNLRQGRRGRTRHAGRRGAKRNESEPRGLDRPASHDRAAPAFRLLFLTHRAALSTIGRATVPAIALIAPGVGKLRQARLGSLPDCVCLLRQAPAGAPSASVVLSHRGRSLIAGALIAR
jgi:hypothetical protein